MSALLLMLWLPSVSAMEEYGPADSRAWAALEQGGDRTDEVKTRDATDNAERLAFEAAMIKAQVQTLSDKLGDVEGVSGPEKVALLEKLLSKKDLHARYTKLTTRGRRKRGNTAIVAELGNLVQVLKEMNDGGAKEHAEDVARSKKTSVRNYRIAVCGLGISAAGLLLTALLSLTNVIDTCPVTDCMETMGL